MERLLTVVCLLSLLADRCNGMIPQFPDENETELEFFKNPI